MSNRRSPATEHGTFSSQSIAIGVLVVIVGAVLALIVIQGQSEPPAEAPVSEPGPPADPFEGLPPDPLDPENQEAAPAESPGAE